MLALEGQIIPPDQMKFTVIRAKVKAVRAAQTLDLALGAAHATFLNGSNKPREEAGAAFRLDGNIHARERKKRVVESNGAHGSLLYSVWSQPEAFPKRAITRLYRFSPFRLFVHALNIRFYCSAARWADATEICVFRMVNGKLSIS
jgi:hypothetical protein